jgi:hypothetical protein
MRIKVGDLVEHITAGISKNKYAVVNNIERVDSFGFIEDRYWGIWCKTKEEALNAPTPPYGDTRGHFTTLSEIEKIYLEINNWERRLKNDI